MVLKILFAIFLFLPQINYASYINLTKSSFSALPAWQEDNQQKALPAFKKSCDQIQLSPPAALFNKRLPAAGQNRTWQQICKAAERIPHTARAAKKFFEAWFIPYQINRHEYTNSLFTGYYLPLIHASTTYSKKYSVPIHGVPNGYHSYYEYPERAWIMQNPRAFPILLWGDSLIDLFFAQIQGSALVELPNHEKLMMSYAGTNGHRYQSIGKILVSANEIPADKISMQAIRAWLRQHRSQVISLLNQDPSYVFFKIQPYRAPRGTGRVPLTPRRSLAVDPHYIAYGTPLWLDSSRPTRSGSYPLTRFQRLLIAQDTGGAIRGALRGDVYWGDGEEAAYIAGHMQQYGQMWMLLPRG